MATQRVPAWKRLGLKLKSAEPQSETQSTSSVPHRSDATFPSDSFDSPKRKREHFGDSAAAKPSLKKPKTDNRQADTPLRRHKSVTFAEGADSMKPTAPERQKTKAPPKKKKSPKTPKPEEPVPPPDLTGPLEYLRLWKTSRDSWKFNKNHQAHLISYAFDPSLFPVADIVTFYEYIRDLKGYARTRLRETAKNICTEDMEDAKDHFTAGTTDVESKKKQYEEIMSNVLWRSQTERKRKHFHEADFTTSRDVHPEVAHRVAKRMRAEIVAEELSDGIDETGDSNVSSTNEKETPSNEASLEADTDKRVKLNDGTTRPVKRVRASKRRGADLDDSSSESSDSDSGNDSESADDSGSGSGSSDDSSSDSSDDSDDEMDVDARPNDQDTSSSSSSSSDDDEDENSDEDSDSDGD